MSNETIQSIGRVKPLVEAQVKSKLVKNRLRRLCSVHNCEKQAQRKGLCARHLTENKRQPVTQTITTFHQPSASLSTENSRNMSYNPTNAASTQEYDEVLSTLDDFDGDHRKPMLSHQIGQNIRVISTNKSSECTYDNIEPINQVGIGRSSISITVPGTSTDTFCETTLNNNTTIDMKTCEYRFLPENGERCCNRATYQCTHCSSTFCLKHGSKHQQTVKEELRCLLEEAKQLYEKLLSLNINSGREHCLNQFKSWMKMIQDKINQQYKEFQMEVDRLHGLVNFNREHLIRSLANHMETKVSDVMKKQLEKDEIDEFEINRARNEFVHIQQLFDILCKQPLISVNNGVGNELILNAPRATLRNLNVDGFNWTEETSTKNPSPIIDFSDLNQVHVEDTIIYQSTNYRDINYTTANHIKISKTKRMKTADQTENTTMHENPVMVTNTFQTEPSLMNQDIINDILETMLPSHESAMENTHKQLVLSSPPPPPPRSRNPRLEEIIANHHDREDLSLKFMALTDVDMEIVAYYAILRNATLTTLDISLNMVGDDGARHLADALANNKVTLNQSSRIAYIVNLLLKQTLTILHVSANNIDKDGAKHLAKVLANNKVTFNQSSPIAYIVNILLIQTLTTLNLYANDIGNDGAERLANALDNNKVTLNQSNWKLRIINNCFFLISFKSLLI
ncbi:unnamed protein product [Rotaria socialis]|uniref:Uncharacterized protein n=1 Tax=Rotaria socialis TaxID=392032 RepID=A0A818RA19_9BILA|nr:unnamed protein product [Rotaria socialis]